MFRAFFLDFKKTEVIRGMLGQRGWWHTARGASSSNFSLQLSLLYYLLPSQLSPAAPDTCLSSGPRGL